MTTQKCFDNEKKHSTLPSFALGMLRRKWPQLLVYFLVMFFSMTVPVMLTVSNSDRSLFYAVREYRAAEISRVTESLLSIGNLSAAFAAALGLFAGCSAMHYLTNRAKAGFMHSLPFRRQTIFVLETASSFLTVILAYAAALLLSLCSVAVGGFAGSGVSSGLWQGALYALYFGFCFFAVSVFSGSVTGSSVIQCLLSLAIVAIAPATYYGVYAFFETFHGEVLWCDYYLSETLLFSSSPLTSLVLFWTDGLSTLTIVLTLAGAVLFLTAGLFCHRFRKTERSAMPVAYDAVGTFVKYLCAFPITVFFGLFFFLLGGGNGWLLFGFACGAVLWTMLVNVIVTRSSRQIFRGWRGLCAFLILFSAFVVVFGADCFGIVRAVPSVAECETVEIEDRRGSRYHLTEQESAELAEILDRGVSSENGVYLPGNGGFIHLALHERGKVFAVRRYYSEEDYLAICAALRKSKNFLDGFLPAFSHPRTMGYEGILLSNGLIQNEAYFQLDLDGAAAFRQCFQRDWEAHQDEIGKMPVSGMVSILCEQGYQSYPLFACFTETNAFLQKALQSYLTDAELVTDENWSTLVSCVESITVVGEKWDVDPYEKSESVDWQREDGLADTEEVSVSDIASSEEEEESFSCVFTDPEEIRQILSCLTSVPGNGAGYYSEYITPYDGRFYVTVSYRTGYGTVSDDLYFLENEIPDVVRAAFGG